MSENHSNLMGGLVAAFAIGALIGGGIALLYAPRSGRETRQLLAIKGRELKDKAQHAIENVKDFVGGDGDGDGHGHHGGRLGKIGL
jgi:gas vesicle protein